MYDRVGILIRRKGILSTDATLTSFWCAIYTTHVWHNELVPDKVVRVLLESFRLVLEQEIGKAAE